MKKKYILSVPEPCSENWEEMSISGKGRDCSKCQKNIRDLSKMSDVELIHLLRTEDNVCGRFDPSQLDRQLLNDRRGLRPTINLYAVAAGIGALISLPAFGADISYVTNDVSLIEMTKGDQTMPTDAAEHSEDSLISIVVTGTHLQTPVPNSKVQLIDIRGAIVDEVTTDSTGTIEYSKMLLEELQVAEIVIEDSEDFQEARIPWSATSPKVTQVQLMSRKRIMYRTMGVAIRPQF